jgi:hypothetical protein
LELSTRSVVGAVVDTRQCPIDTATVLPRGGRLAPFWRGERKEKPMKRIILTISAAALLALWAPAAVLADAGAPGSTYPEQPGANVGNACATITSNPGTGTGGQAGHASQTAAAIVSGLLVDACLGG